MQIDHGLEKLLSRARLAGYSTSFAVSKYDSPLKVYKWNMCLAEALYPLPQTVEVGLRNAINELVAEHYKSPNWILGVDLLNTSAVIVVQRQKEQLSKDATGPVTIGKIIASLNFGFWTSLLDAPYEEKFWRTKILKYTFPNMPRELRTRKNISTVFAKIRRLRNRIFHYEPIWHWQDLLQQHDLIVEAINWLGPQLQELIEIDRFKEVYSRGSNGKK